MRFNILRDYSKFLFHYLHFKYPDSKGEDGDFEGKVKALEEIDAELRLVQELNPHTLLITGDHCTPAAIGGHGWHFVPYLIKGPYSFRDDVTLFSEKECVSHGYYGRQAGVSLMPELLAQSGRLRKYGA